MQDGSGRKRIYYKMCVEYKKAADISREGCSCNNNAADISREDCSCNKNAADILREKLCFRIYMAFP